jgi:hypothetical protein
MSDRTNPSRATREEEARDARVRAGAPETPTPEEEQAAESNRHDPVVGEHEREMNERGAHQKGEGRIP